jgi:nitrous oxidase accessory protein NosD
VKLEEKRDMKDKKRLHSAALASIAVVLFLIVVSSTASAATLQVDAKHYKTIQSAVNAAHSGDTIKVARGIYKENILITDKQLTIIGIGYPVLYGARLFGGVTGMLYGLSFNKNGAELSDGVRITIRNCIFTNCGIDITGQTCTGNVILKNKITKGGIVLSETYDNIIQGNYIYKCKIGLSMGMRATCKSVTKNTFANCQVAAQLEKVPAGMIGNIYTKNKVNIKIVPIDV